MAESIARGAVGSGVLPPSRIRTASHTNPVRRQALESFGVKVLTHNQDVVKDSDVVIFSVKPQVVAAGVKLKDLQGSPLSANLAGALYIYKMIVEETLFLESQIGAIPRVMSMGEAATEEDENLISKLFGSVGKIWKADEKYFDAVAGLSGGGPAYIYLAIEALAYGEVAAGLPRDLALSLASQECAASMATSTGKHRGQLKDDVSSPGGTTIAGIHEFEKGGFLGVLMNAVVAAAKSFP